MKELKAEELRIGNFVEEKGDFVKIGLRSFEYIKENDKLFFSWVKPIPLTEEWLVKFGFERQPFAHENNKDYKYDNIFIQEHTEVNDFICCNTSPDFIQVKYVHQLQNLYHALTGDELKLKEAK